jgi:hypothetical protein
MYVSSAAGRFFVEGVRKLDRLKFWPYSTPVEISQVGVHYL